MRHANGWPAHAGDDDDASTGVGLPRDKKPGHAFVLGSGIAGLSLAEILSRNGWRITLLDSATELGGDASRNTQNWLHTGWLYAALPHDAAMSGCHRALQLFHKAYDSVLPREVVNVEPGEHGVSYSPSSVGWFSAECVYYLYAIAAHELKTWQRLLWPQYLNFVPLRRLRKLGYSTDAVSDLPRELVRLMNHWERDDAGYEKYRVTPSTDARICTRRVLSSLLALLGEDAEVVPGARYEIDERGGRSVIRIDGEAHTPDLVVMASGKAIPEQLRRLGRDALAGKFKSVSSPIVVLDRALPLPNFIRFTPELTETVNHIKYAIEGVGEVSTLGSYDAFPVGKTPDITPFITRMCEHLDVPKACVLGSYYGTKTEFTGELARCYNHAVEPVNANTYFAVAGKFSQFPLLVEDFANRVGLRVDIANETRGTLHMGVRRTAPEEIACGLAGAPGHGAL